MKPITSFKTHPVRFLSMSDGGTLCYSYDGEIYTQQPDATPKKVAIELVRDDRPQFANLQSPDGATSAVVSPENRLPSRCAEKSLSLRQTMPLPSR